MAFATSIILAYLVSTAPIVHLRFIDKMASVENCSAVIEAVKRQEILEPEDEQIHTRLRCLAVSLKIDQDDDGPSKPVAVPPTTLNSPVTGYPCRKALTGLLTPCKEASYSEQPLHTQ